MSGYEMKYVVRMQFGISVPPRAVFFNCTKCGKEFEADGHSKTTALAFAGTVECRRCRPKLRIKK